MSELGIVWYRFSAAFDSSHMNWGKSFCCSRISRTTFLQRTRPCFLVFSLSVCTWGFWLLFLFRFKKLEPFFLECSAIDCWHIWRRYHYEQSWHWGRCTKRQTLPLKLHHCLRRLVIRNVLELDLLTFCQFGSIQSLLDWNVTLPRDINTQVVDWNSSFLFFVDAVEYVFNKFLSERSHWLSESSEELEPIDISFLV